MAEGAEALDQDRRRAAARGQLGCPPRVLERLQDVAAQHRHLGRELVRLGAERVGVRLPDRTLAELERPRGALLAQPCQPQQRCRADLGRTALGEERLEVGSRLRGIAAPDLVARRFEAADGEVVVVVDGRQPDRFLRDLGRRAVGAERQVARALLALADDLREPPVQRAPRPRAEKRVRTGREERVRESVPMAVD